MRLSGMSLCAMREKRGLHVGEWAVTEDLALRYPVLPANPAPFPAFREVFLTVLLSSWFCSDAARKKERQSLYVFQEEKSVLWSRLALCFD